MGIKVIGKRFFAEEFSKCYLKRFNYHLIHNDYDLNYFYFNCFSEFMFNEKFYNIYIDEIKKYILDDISDEEYIDLRFVRTKSDLDYYLNEISLKFFKDFMKIKGKDGFLIFIANPDENILNSNFVENLQEIYNKFNSVIPITFIITSKWEAFNKFKTKSFFENIIYNKIEPLSDNEVRNYLKGTFEEMMCIVDEEIIDDIIYLSNGHSSTMCRLGSACYDYVWVNKDYTTDNCYYWRNIRKENFYRGLYKYITSPYIINNYFASNENIAVLTKFLSILNKLFLEFKSKYDGSFYFNSNKFSHKLSDYEKDIFDDCLEYLVKNNILIEIDLDKNIYRFDEPGFLINSKIIWEYSHLTN